MDNRRWRYDPHQPPAEEPAGWVVAGQQRYDPAPWEDGHAGGTWPGDAGEPGRWHPAEQHPPGQYAGGPYAPQQYAGDPYAPQQHAPPEHASDWYASRPANGYEAQWRTPDPYPADSYPPDPYPPAGPQGDPYGHPAYQPDPYPPDRTRVGTPPDPRTPPGGWAGGEGRWHTGGVPSRRQRRQPIAEQPEEEPEELPVPTMPALTWTVGYFIGPVLLYLVWALTRSGVAAAGCVDATGDPCPAPRAEAVGSLADALPALAGALALAVLAAAALRRIATAWRPATIGLAAAVVGAGFATLVAAVLG